MFSKKSKQFLSFKSLQPITWNHNLHIGATKNPSEPFDNLNYPLHWLFSLTELTIVNQLLKGIIWSAVPLALLLFYC